MNTAVRFYFAGAAVANASENGVRILAPCIVRGISVQVITAGTGANVATWVVRKNAVSQAQTLTLNAGATNASSFTNCTSFAVGDLLSLQGSTNGSNNNPANTQIMLNIYG